MGGEEDSFPINEKDVFFTCFSHGLVTDGMVIAFSRGRNASLQKMDNVFFQFFPIFSKIKEMDTKTMAVGKRYRVHSDLFFSK